MKVGGNQAASEYFSKHGSQTVLNAKDATVKYTSKTAQNYKDMLTKKAKEDAEANPELVVADMEENNTPVLSVDSSPTGSPAAVKDSRDDFFGGGWDKKSPSASPARTPTTPSTPSSRTPNSQPSNRTTSASLRAKTTIGARTNKPVKGGIRKGAAINFAEAEARAKEEAERAERLGYNAAEEEDMKDSPFSQEPTKKESQFSSKPVHYEPSAAQTQNEAAGRESMERLGIGMSRLGFGATGSGATQPTKSKSPVSMMGGFGSTSANTDSESESSYAREKFSHAKSISSDQYFGRNQYDAAAQAEATARLSQFSGATSISSSQYFGRDDEEDMQRRSSDVDWSDLQGSAGEFARKFVGQAAADLDSLKQVVQTGSSKLQDMLQDIQHRYNY
ncbi:hypothetical protein BZG36_03231 [Bifiguratus adelaidae]|uniref:ADP-ribosylation factor GTPase-activating protein glo3 n=1 Tax=Bifiguratus adelaidae TaxID=1938954 RepID=A0A261XWY9_9FUNG|nr:hypothetical protein BZG36_03231 [Bifiguratus adelaidae]